MQTKVSKFSWFLTIWLLLNVCGVSHAFQEPVLEVNVVPRDITLGERINVTLSLRQEASGSQNLIEAPNLALPPLDGFLLRAQQSESRTVTHNQGLALLVKANYVLEPVRAGELEIPSLTLSYRIQGKVQEVQTQAIKITVHSSVSRIERSFSILWLLIAGAGFFAFAVFMRRLQRKKGAVQMNETPKVSVSFPQEQWPKTDSPVYTEHPPISGPDFAGMTDAEATEKLKSYILSQIGELKHLPSSDLSFEKLQMMLDDPSLMSFVNAFAQRYQRYKYGQQPLSLDERKDFLARFEKYLSK